ncbi:MAG: hypothetical protein JXE06_04040 [Coriobacteriia bacterium]|nr:hypothetical protein [Coriobacteriia bacterium]MBN2823358.1 hypothetical protein [Coriobacteriia bacterium]
MAHNAQAVRATPAVDRKALRLPFGLLLAAVFAAGSASLVYEVVWVRQLGMSLGSTAIASSVMLSAFLGGLAVGSWLSGRKADESPSPLKSLVRIEIAAAVIGAVSVPVLAAAGRAYVLVAVTTSAGSETSLVLRALFSLVAMFIPAALFGMTFPVATAAAARLVDVDKAGGGISAASSFGSAAGAAAAGLFLEPLLGLTESAYAGASLNILAALLALAALTATSRLSRG